MYSVYRPYWDGPEGVLLLDIYIHHYPGGVNIRYLVVNVGQDEIRTLPQ